MDTIYNTMPIEIPKSFQLLGHTYKVEISDKLYEDEQLYGDCDVEKKLIRIQSTGPVNRVYPKTKKVEVIDITEQDLLETFYHELVHAILYSMGEEKLFCDEKFVGLMGRCLMESLTNFNNVNKKTENN